MNYPFFIISNHETKYCIFDKPFNLVMKTAVTHLFFLFLCGFCFSQKDALNLGDKYADDQVYVSVAYSQFYDQPASVSRSNFSYSLSTGFIKDLILNKQGNFSVGAGIGYGLDFFNHELKVEEVNNNTIFSSDTSIRTNLFKSQNLEFPLELRWRTSNANKYEFWRVYAGIKFLYNLSNNFQFDDTSNMRIKYSDISSYNKLQYGLTFSAGYDEFNINIFYGLTPIFNNGKIDLEDINTKILKFGLIFYFL